MKQKTILKITFVIVIIFAFKFWQQQDMPRTSPILTLKTITNKVISSKSDEPIVVHFWATWCKLCYYENSNIQTIMSNHKVLNIAISSGDDANIIQYANKNNLILDNIINDKTGELSRQFAVKGTPTSFIIKDSKIKFIEVGYTTTIGMRIRLWLAKYI